MTGHPLVRSHRFDPAAHVVEAFDCGHGELDHWLQSHATVAAAMRTAVTYVWVRNGAVVAYYALAAHAIARDDTPKSIGRNAPEHVPAVLLGKLALDRSLHGRGLGRALLLDAFARLASPDNPLAARLLVVDAIDGQARDFYARHQFNDMVNHPLSLWVSMKHVVATVAAAVGAVEAS